MVIISFVQLGIVVVLGPRALIVTDFCNLFSLVALAVGGWNASRTGRPGAWEYFVAEVMFGVSIFIWTLGKIGWLQDSFWVRQAPTIGAMVEIVFFSSAVIRLIENFKVSAEQSQFEQERAETLQRFVRVLAHDLANPLSIVSSSVKLLEVKDLVESPQGIKMVSKISRASAQIQVIIEDTRQLIAIQSGKMQIDLKRTRIAGVVEDSRFIFEDRLKSKNLDLAVEFSDPDLEVFADHSSLVTIILNNLISNAIKFSPVGAKIFLEAKKETNGHILLIIRDQGIGMPAELIEKVFDPGASTSRAGTEGEKGTGFGMPLVKQFVQAFGANISIESKEKSVGETEHGTLIKIDFPPLVKAA